MPPSVEPRHQAASRQVSQPWRTRETRQRRRVGARKNRSEQWTRPKTPGAEEATAASGQVTS
eukprot:9871622-Lingulodinium_polyedra.AAC.1